MELSEGLSSLQRTHKLLIHSGSSTEYIECLVQLGEVVSATVSNPGFRDELVLSGALETTLNVLSRSKPVSSTSELETLYLRLLRGTVLALRNLVPASDLVLETNKIFDAILLFIHNASRGNPFYLRCFVAYSELLANCSSKYKANLKVDPCYFAQSITKEGFQTILVSNYDALQLPINTFMSACLLEHYSAGLILLSPKSRPLLEYLSNVEIETHQELLSVIETLITHEKFKSWISGLLEDDTARKFLASASLAATHREDWDNIQCVTMLSWSFEIVKKASPIAISMLLSDDFTPSRLAVLHRILVKALDVLADLSKFNCAQQFLLEYGVLDVIIPLFRAIYENVSTKTMTSIGKVQEIPSKEFPVITSLIIELMAFACHSSFAAQERIRDLHGLELVLSSCVIDDDNPFMKERAILCLKFLLEKNQKNQKFVAELEAEKVADSTALVATGYELNLEGGKVQVKKKRQ